MWIFFCFFFLNFFSLILCSYVGSSLNLCVHLDLTAASYSLYINIHVYLHTLQHIIIFFSFFFCFEHEKYLHYRDISYRFFCFLFDSQGGKVFSALLVFSQCQMIVGESGVSTF